MGRITVAEIMTRNPIIVKPDISILECAKKMVRKRVGSLIIADKKKFLGLISNRDILWALVKKHNVDMSNIKAIDISPKKVVTIKSSATINEVINKMKKVKFFRVPVVRNKEVVGIVTMRDVLSFHPELYRELGEFEQIREETEKINRLKQAERREIVTDGICEECGERGSLYRENGVLMCSSCLSV